MTWLQVLNRSNDAFTMRCDTEVDALYSTASNITLDWQSMLCSSYKDLYTEIQPRTQSSCESPYFRTRHISSIDTLALNGFCTWLRRLVRQVYSTAVQQEIYIRLSYDTRYRSQKATTVRSTFRIYKDRNLLHVTLQMTL